MNADRLRVSLADLGLSQVLLSKLLSCSTRTITYWLHGTNDIPGSVDILIVTWQKFPETLKMARRMRGLAEPPATAATQGAEALPVVAPSSSDEMKESATEGAI